MKLPILKILFTILGIVIMSDYCDRENSITLTNTCIKGMFIGYYCEGCVIKIMDNSNIGKNWNATYGNEIYENSVVASIDTIYLKSTVGIEKYLTKGSIFYFQYKEGGYPRKQYNICDPPPFITITLITSSPCSLSN